MNSPPHRTPKQEGMAATVFCEYLENQLRCTYLVLLPLSVIIMVVSGVLGIVNLLGRVKWLLVVTGILLMFGALVTMCGVCVYVAYCAAIYRQATAILLSAGKSLEDVVDVRFGWSLALACVSLVGEALTGAAFLVTAWRLSHQRTREDQGIEIK
ncbi:transmembrane protein 114 [Sardina pilchardus]|uniref:transmembrane protein 114 n=1 Tax=Sardina pilchardus TaxID=27697 RepID=UPI002E13E299